MGNAEYEELRAQLARRMERPLRGLEHLTALRTTLLSIERRLVFEARWNYCSWEEIGSALGISRQAAHRRHRRFVNQSSGVWHESDTARGGDGEP